MLGMYEGDMPRKMEKEQMFGIDYFADFEVCPFEAQREGEMQMVCVESASHVVIVDHTPEDRGKPAILRKLNGRIDD